MKARTVVAVAVGALVGFFWLGGAGATLAADTTPLVEAAAAPVQASGQISVPRGSLGTPLMDRLRSVLGLLSLVFIAWLLSNNRRNVQWRVVLWGLSLQLLFALSSMP